MLSWLIYVAYTVLRAFSGDGPGERKFSAALGVLGAANLPIIPTVYGVVFDEYNTSKFTGWPSESDPYESGSPNAPTNEVVILRLRPVS